MAKNMQPIVKRCRTLGISPAVMGYTGDSKRESIRNPGAQRRGKKSEYALQLNEKQKVKFIYGVLERQFRNYYEKATKAEGQTGEELLFILEHRLDSVVYRLGFATTRRDARQAVTHAHFTVNGKKVNIPSYIVKTGDVIAVAENSRSSAKFKVLNEEGARTVTPKWLAKTENNPFEGKVVAKPQRDDIDYEVNEQLIVELYSK